ncbi:hypothetical protein EJK55_0488 [Moraxella catarrhalis]|uniref:Uncharacterized protein n=1 Tax=Moraxella catarrhalis TaxID=480 RepID=A0A3Q9GD07_MORCA|nr:hypothetical protein MCR_0768 [Moraxella catarrhalis BBH18]AZQ87802.1 hypothetical protein EJK52_0812 [Moraxella catarrhalis]EKF83846.1 hypothetical protein MCRH_0836 [Moraxella catarrhalis RH4]AZQ88990.1 hypothetical protein EJK50_0809 [Moraxella catarrhalis]AZQ91383.1 hypothetical protein EJK51_0810 [Moraxella catarrhalis]
MIEYHLNLEAKELFDDEIGLDESYFGSIRKVHHLISLKY